VSDVPSAAEGRAAYAGFWRRFAAYVVDYVVVFAGSAALVLIASVTGLLPDGAPRWSAIVLAGYFLYCTLLESSSSQATLGKRAFGLKVIGVRRSAQQAGDPVDEMHPPTKLGQLLPRADWIVVSCPLTKETRNLLDAAAFARMKPGARLINIARGEIVDEAAMIEALKSGRLAGAALDAHRQEPLPKDSPLWDLPNVIVTPHNASASSGNEQRCAEMFIANFGHWLRGEPLFNVQRV